MKIKLITLIIGILLVTSVVAISSFSNYDEAIIEWLSKKETQNSTINSAVSSSRWSWNNQKSCEIIDEHSVTCRRCFDFEYTYNKINYKESGCITLNKETTEHQDNSQVDDYIKAYIEKENPIEKVIFNDAELGN